MSFESERDVADVAVPDIWNAGCGSRLYLGIRATQQIAVVDASSGGIIKG